MSTKNDKTILELKEKIEIKKATLKEIEGFTPKTTCIFDFNGKHNIHTFNMEECVFWRALFTSMLKANESYGDSNELILNGFTMEDWNKDVCSKLRVLSIESQKKELAQMEAKLDKLLSADKKAEMELASIAELLGL